MRKTKPETTGALVPKTVGVPMSVEDLVALGAYRDAEAKRTLVRPKEGPSAAAIFRAGVVALGFWSGS